MSTINIQVQVIEAYISISMSRINSRTVLSVSEGVHELLGFKADDFLTGKISLQSRIHTHDQDIAEHLFLTGIKPALGSFNVRLRHADGRIRCVKGYYSNSH